jgi:hypothetical protein
MIRRLVGALALFSASLVLAPSSGSAQELPRPIFAACPHCCTSQIRFVAGPRLDLLILHARVIPGTAISPSIEDFVLSLDNGNGTIFSQTIPGGSIIERNPTFFVYRDKSAAKNGGIAKLQIKEKNDSAGGFVVDVVAYGDLSAATLATMSVFIAIGDDPFTDTSVWTQRPHGWTVDFPPP